MAIMRKLLATFSIAVMTISSNAQVPGDRPAPNPRATRSVVLARNGIIATSQPMASAAGLAVLQQEPKVRQELSAIIDRFLRRTGWHPTMTKPVAGALLYTRYNPFMRWFMKRIVQKGGGDTDTTRDYEYTDWNDLRAFADQFGALVQHDAASGGDRTRRPRVA